MRTKQTFASFWTRKNLTSLNFFMVSFTPFFPFVFLLDVLSLNLNLNWLAICRKKKFSLDLPVLTRFLECMSCPVYGIAIILERFGRLFSLTWVGYQSQLKSRKTSWRHKWYSDRCPSRTVLKSMGLISMHVDKNTPFFIVKSSSPAK